VQFSGATRITRAPNFSLGFPLTAVVQHGRLVRFNFGEKTADMLEAILRPPVAIAI
jgi:hypothetical protein